VTETPEPAPTVSPSPKVIQELQASVPAACAMLAGMQLEIFTHLAGGPRDAATLAATLGVAEDRLQRLLYALVATGLLELREGAFVNAPEAATYLVKGRPIYLGGMHELLGHLWHVDLRTAQSIRSGEPAALHDYNAASDDEMAAMLRALHTNALNAGRDFLTRFDFSTARSVIDVGGGSGGVIATLCHAYPDLHGTLFDLPRTTKLAEPILRNTPGGDRVAVEAGDIVQNPPKGMHDAVIMRALVQVLSPADAARAIANAATSLRAFGTMYIVGAGILDDSRLSPQQAVFMNVTFMNLYRAGAAYTEAEHAAWLSAAGCELTERITLPTGSGIILARKQVE
jgi:O-methyltransferase domain/Dimerisation domain